MKTKNVVLGSLIICYVMLCSSILYGKDLHHSLGLYYVSGLDNVVDTIEHNLEEEGYSVDTFEWPIGLSYQPYFQFDSGVIIGAGIGPIMVVFGDVDFYDVPIKFNIGYSFFQKSYMSPYVKIGTAYHVVGGDYVDNGAIGITTSVGIQLSKHENFAWGLELTYDSTEVDFDYYKNGRRTTKSIKPAELLIGLFVVF